MELLIWQTDPVEYDKCFSELGVMGGKAVFVFDKKNLNEISIMNN